MTILEPSAAATEQQVWPPAPDSPRGRWEAGTPVTMDQVRLGDTVTFWADARTLSDRPSVRVGEVVKIQDMRGRLAVVWVATKHGRHPLTRKNWERAQPRR